MILRAASGALLVLLGLALLSPGMVVRLTGLPPLGQPSPEALDQLARVDNHDSPMFFDARNRLEVEVPRAMTAEDFLDLYLIDQPHIRAEIAQQEGWPSFQESAILEPGTAYTITLTPPKPEDEL